MTSAEFMSRYKLLDQLTSSGVLSYNAHDGARRAVMVHISDGRTSDAHGRVLRQVQSLERPDRDLVIETLNVDGSTVIVTQVLSGFESFERWLDARSAVPATVSGAAPARPAAPPKSLTEMFTPSSHSSQVPASAPPTPQPVQAASQSAPPAQPRTPPARQRSDYTQVIAPVAQTPPAGPGSGAGSAARTQGAGGGDASELSSALTSLEERLKSYLQLVVLLNVVIGAAVVLVLYFLLKR